MKAPHPLKVYCSKSCTNVAYQLALHGMTMEQYRDWLAVQDNRCAICRRGRESWWHGKKDNVRDGWHIDHDHKTGRVRGILCPPCNLMPGNANDDVERLRAAVDYLQM